MAQKYIVLMVLRDQIRQPSRLPSTCPAQSHNLASSRNAFERCWTKILSLSTGCTDAAVLSVANGLVPADGSARRCQAALRGFLLRLARGGSVSARMLLKRQRAFIDGDGRRNEVL